MKKVVSFSGGRTSAYLCKLMIEKFGRENVDFIFMDTGAEHPKTYEFIKNVNGFLGLNLTCLRGDFNQDIGVGHSYIVVDIESLKCDFGPFTEMVKKYGTPTVVSGWCTSRMKQEVHDKYCNDKYGKNEYQTWLGIRADEPKRLGNIGNSDKVKYMAEISDAEKEDVLGYWSEQDFDLNLPEWLGNCVFCFKKSNLKLASAAIDEPELLKQWLAMVENATERGEQARKSRHVMYRKKQTLQQVIATFDGSTGVEIKARIRGGKMIDTNSCSESCEVFQ